MPGNKLDYELLQQIATQSGASQRALAVRLGVSVGKVNYCLRALIEKGWVKASNFRRSDHKWAFAYLLTPSGVSAKLQLTRDFLTRKELEFEQLRGEIAVLRSEVLHGQSVTQALLPGNTTRRAHIKAYDPVATGQARRVLRNLEGPSLVSNQVKALEGSYALLIDTEWKEFKAQISTPSSNGSNGR